MHCGPTSSLSILNSGLEWIDLCRRYVVRRARRGHTLRFAKVRVFDYG